MACLLCPPISALSPAAWSAGEGCGGCVRHGERPRGVCSSQGSWTFDSVTPYVLTFPSLNEQENRCKISLWNSAFQWFVGADSIYLQKVKYTRVSLSDPEHLLRTSCCSQAPGTEFPPSRVSVEVSPSQCGPQASSVGRTWELQLEMPVLGSPLRPRTWTLWAGVRWAAV